MQIHRLQILLPFLLVLLVISCSTPHPAKRIIDPNCKIPEGKSTQQNFLDKTKKISARKTTRYALRKFDQEFKRSQKKSSTLPLAYDLGAGAGNDTLLLLKKGWRVVSIDISQDSINLIQQRVKKTKNKKNQTRLKTIQTSFEKMKLNQKADLIVANFSLPFVAKENFESVWKKIVRALKKGGRFAGHFYGNRHSWMPIEKTMSFHSKKEIEESFFRSFEIETIVEVEYNATSTDCIKTHWHYFSIVAKKI